MVGIRLPEPIVCTPEGDFHCFLRKEDQDPTLKRNYEGAFDLG
jgi:hypothetical protein